MPSLNYSLDVFQGFNYKKDKQTKVGFITKMKVGTDELAVDITCKDPLNPATDLKVVAVLSQLMWETGTTDPVLFSGQICTNNKNKLAELGLKGLTNIEVVFQFICYDYDPTAKKYFKCFHAQDTDMKGLIQKQGADLMLQVADDVATEVQSPRNFAMTIGVKAQPISQALVVAVADQKNIVKQWGVAEG